MLDTSEIGALRRISRVRAVLPLNVPRVEESVRRGDTSCDDRGKRSVVLSVEEPWATELSGGIGGRIMCITKFFRLSTAAGPHKRERSVKVNVRTDSDHVVSGFLSFL